MIFDLGLHCRGHVKAFSRTSHSAVNYHRDKTTDTISALSAKNRTMATATSIEIPKETCVTQMKLSWTITGLRNQLTQLRDFTLKSDVFSACGSTWYVIIKQLCNEDYLGGSVNIFLKCKTQVSPQVFVACTFTPVARDARCSGEQKKLTSCAFSHWYNTKSDCGWASIPTYIVQSELSMAGVEDATLEVSLKASLRPEDVLHFENDQKTLIRHLNLLRSGARRDRRIQIDDRLFEVHGEVLDSASMSPEHSMFMLNLHQHWTLATDIDPDVFDIFLQFLYTGKYPENFDENAESLMFLAFDYRITSLLQLCIAHFGKMDWDHDVATSLILVSSRYSSSSMEFLKHRLFAYLDQNLHLLYSDEFNWIERNFPKVVIEFLKRYAKHKARK